MKPPPVVLTIAGSDNSCGAGLQADLKTITTLGGYAQTAVTCVVAEVPGAVEMIQAVRPAVVASQVRLSLRAFPVKAAKTGMLFSRGIIEAVAEALAAVPELPVVVDPVMVASSGDPLLEPPAIAAYRRLLFPRATLQGGHLGGRVATDILVTPAGSERVSAAFRRGIDTHGTGCTYSAAIATGLARGLSLVEAVRRAKAYITAAIGGTLRWGKTMALDHRVRPDA